MLSSRDEAADSHLLLVTLTNGMTTILIFTFSVSADRAAGGADVMAHKVKV